MCGHVSFSDDIFGFSTYRRKNNVLGTKKRPKTMIFEPRPQCSPKPVRGSKIFGGGRRRYENYWALVWSFHDKKVAFLGSKNEQKPRFSNPGPNVHRNRSGKILGTGRPRAGRTASRENGRVHRSPGAFSPMKAKRAIWQRLMWWQPKARKT